MLILALAKAEPIFLLELHICCSSLCLEIIVNDLNQIDLLHPIGVADPQSMTKFRQPPPRLHNARPIGWAGEQMAAAWSPADENGGTPWRRSWATPGLTWSRLRYDPHIDRTLIAHETYSGIVIASFNRFDFGVISSFSFFRNDAGLPAASE